MLFNTGNVYLMKEWYESALMFYIEALPIYERRNDSEKIQNVYHAMAQIYANIDNVEKAIEYGEKAVALNNEDEFSMLALGKAYYSANQYEKVKHYLEDALRLCDLHNNSYLMGSIYFLLGTIAMYEFDLELFEKYAHQSLEINRQISHAACVSSFILLSYLEQMRGAFDKSEAYAKEALEIATEYELLEVKRVCYIALYGLSLAQRNYRESIHYLQEIDKAEVAIGQESSRRSSEEMAAKYETEK